MASQLPAYKQDFLKAAIAGGVLKFGSFELKSKRISPYFFNAGEFHSARLAGAISTAFAQSIIDAQQNSGLDFDIIFGPAYKGIPLCSAIAIKIGEQAPQNLDKISYSDAIKKIRKEGGVVAGIVVALDRMEKLPAADGDDSQPGPSAIGELRKEFGIPILAILTLDDIIEGMKSFASEDDIKRTEEYRQKYKATD
ncbi:Orotate phosphoribosyltransferase [Tolypocladium paradoxum]|uniref:Orotate phosphoribosyltransferase n=1 Tax=Tolypocladium paradoxum TaxID=94208 RepID=A0A2S4KWN8_9HYPO|nr:Orotate phosphoribosyltransferase [Tolypocladium paradoxum]